MSSVVVIVEGPSEAEFVRRTLTPHLLEHGVYAAKPFIVTTQRNRRTGQKTGRGGGRWKQWRSDIHSVLKSDTRAALCVTTMIDLYGLPPDFPERAHQAGDQNPTHRVARLEAAMGDEIPDRRFLSYIQMHEFEALVLAAIDHSRETIDFASHTELDELRRSIGDREPEAAHVMRAALRQAHTRTYGD